MDGVQVRKVQPFIWERRQKAGAAGYQDWILKAIAWKITTDVGGSIGMPQQQSSTEGLHSPHDDHENDKNYDQHIDGNGEDGMWCYNDDENNDNAIRASVLGCILIGDAGSAVSFTLWAHHWLTMCQVCDTVS